jgi:hypothetical protein
MILDLSTQRDFIYRRQPKLEEGAKVEVWHKGRSRFYKGKITRVRTGGRAFDILHEDGEKEMGVKKDSVRALGGSNGGLTGDYTIF